MNKPDARVVTLLPVAAIAADERLRPVDPAHAQMLAENIAQTGVLRSPLEVRPLAAGRYALIAGAHRLAAVAALGWETVPAFLVTADDDAARLMEIDENLVRHELNPLDRAVFLAERKAIWERLHPETRAGVAGGKARQGAATEIISFAADTARRVGLTERSIRLAVAIATQMLPEVRAAIAGTAWARKQSDLQALAKAAPATQRAVLALLQGGQETSVKAALKRASGQRAAEPSPVEVGLSRLMAVWGRAPAAAQRQFVAHLRASGALGAEDDTDAMEAA